MVKVRSIMGGSVFRSTEKVPIFFRAAPAAPTSSSLLAATNMLPSSANWIELAWYRPSATGIYSAHARERTTGVQKQKHKQGGGLN